MIRDTVDRAWRDELLIQRDQLLELRAELHVATEDGSVRLDAAKLTHLETSAQVAAIDSRLASVESALARLESGSFGMCGVCGDSIPEERLEVRPDAEFCVPCCERRRQSA